MMTHPESTKATILETSGIAISFGGLKALDGVDFHLERGEIRGLIGPNGSGKTTLINLVTGVYRPDSGEIYFEGENVTGMSPNGIARKGLCRTFQVPRIFGDMSLLDNMLIPRFPDLRRGYRHDLPAATDQAGQLLTDVGLIRLRDEPAKTLSGGQKALLQLARGFMRENISAFMLDEPFAGVNMVVKQTMIDLIRQKAEQGIGFVLVSHEMTTIRQMCPRVTVLALGSVIAHGSMEEVAAMEHVVNAYLGGEAL